MNCNYILRLMKLIMWSVDCGGECSSYFNFHATIRGYWNPLWGGMWILWTWLDGWYVVCFCYADVVSNGYLLFLLPFIVTVTGTVGIPCFICSDNPNWELVESFQAIFGFTGFILQVGVIGNLVHSSVNIKKEVLAAGALQPVIGLLRSVIFCF
jgi:hypothetical protein